MRKRLFGVAAGVVALGLIAGGIATLATVKPAQADQGGMPRFQHIFYIMMENQAYSEIIGNSNAPHLNALAQRYALADNYYGVIHPSEPNYVASVGGSYYTVTATTSSSSVDFTGDSPYYCDPGSAAAGCAGVTGDHQINSAYLGSQLEDAGLTWKTYQQSMPSVGFQGTVYPSSSVALYAAKHNPFLNFLASYGPAPRSASFTPNAAQQAELQKMVPLDDANVGLRADLANGTVPNFAYIVPDQCHDMHGTGGCSDSTQKIQQGDAYVGQLVSEIMASKTWRTGNNAIVITWDENDYSGLDCNTNVPVASIGCQVPTIVIANHGPRGEVYSTPSNHYSLLLSIEQAFGLGCVQQSCPTAENHVQPMMPMFRK